MARIAGVDIPPQKRVVISLMYIHGIGRTTAEKLVKMANINPDTRVKDLSDEEVGAPSPDHRPHGHRQRDPHRG